VGKIAALILVLVFLTAACITMPFPVKAESRTIVVPDDYPTIAEAIGNATESDTILVRTGTYDEHSLVITKSISLIGENAENTIIKDIDSPTPLFGSSIMVGPTAITISADNVTISGFTINNGDPDIGGGGVGTLIIGNKLPHGITLSKGSYQTVSQNTVEGNIHSEVPYTLICNNTVSGSGTLGFGALILVEAAGNSGYNNVVYGNTIIGNNIITPTQGQPNQGITIYMSYGNIVANNTMTKCYAGINLDLTAQNKISANTVSTNYFGISAIQGSGENIFNSNNVMSNTYATAIVGLNNTVYDNNFIDNVQQIGNPDLIMGPNPPADTFWFQGTRGNYWSDYLSRYPHSSEVDSTGVGDIPYVIDANNTDPYPLMAPYNTSSLTIQLPTWADLSVLTWLPTVSFPPQPSSTSTPATPTPSLPSPTPAPSEPPTPSPTSPEVTSPSEEPELSLTSVAAASVATVAVAGIALVVYFKKRKH
jgi:nitrous oxidase accessory protein